MPLQGKGWEFESPRIHQIPLDYRFRSLPFQGGVAGSIPARDTKIFETQGFEVAQLEQYALYPRYVAGSSPALEFIIAGWRSSISSVS